MLTGYTISEDQLNCIDPSSFANHQYVQMTEFFVDFKIDFEKKILETVLDVKLVVRQANAVVASFDSKEINVDKVEQISGLKGDVVTADVKFAYGEEDPFDQGKRFVVGLPQDKATQVGDEFFYRFTYKTAPTASAAQFLDPSSTGTGKPYFYTQCQATHCRSLLIIQDACACKIKFSSRATIPADLNMVASGYLQNKVTEGDVTIFNFDMPFPIPPYLYAIAIGDIVQSKLSDRTNVYAEPHELEVAKIEYAQLGEILNKVEETAGPYRWGTYSILSMPTAFPFGGMEGILTFNSGSLLPLPREKLCPVCQSSTQLNDNPNGDKKKEPLGIAVAVGIHEACHSWSGNLVTNTDWCSFFLNEGLTMFLQLRTQRKLYGAAEEGLNLLINWEDLKDSIALFQKSGDDNATKLVPSLLQTSAEDIFSSVPYHKGEALFYYLEEIMVQGGAGNELAAAIETTEQAKAERFETFLKQYFVDFAFKNVNHDEFKAYYIAYCEKYGFTARLSEIDWDTWFHSAGMPIYKPKADLSLAHAAYAAAEVLLPKNVITLANDNAQLNEEQQQIVTSIAKFSPSQQNVFLDKLLELFDEQYNVLVEKSDKQALQKAVRDFTLPALNNVIQFGASYNCELLSRYLYFLIRANVDKDAIIAKQDNVTFIQTLAWFSATVGRMKFCRPITRIMLESEQFSQFAIDNFEKAKLGYHPMAAQMVAKDIAAAKAKPELKY